MMSCMGHVISYDVTMMSYLCNDGETGINCGRLVDVKHKVWIFDQIDPEPQWETGGGRKGGREGRREGGRERGRQGGREGGREGRERGRGEGVREGEREGRKKKEREGRRTDHFVHHRRCPLSCSVHQKVSFIRGSTL